jgi:hypothetical protein
MAARNAATNPGTEELMQRGERLQSRIASLAAMCRRANKTKRPSRGVAAKIRRELREIEAEFGALKKSAAGSVQLPAPSLSVEAVLTSAARIVNEAADRAVEVDWSRDPLTPREAAIRAEVIRIIEVENTTGSEEVSGPHYVYEALSHLLDDDEEKDMGGDLFAALERWRAAWLADDERERRTEGERLVGIALLNLSMGRHEAPIGTEPQ